MTTQHTPGPQKATQDIGTLCTTVTAGRLPVADCLIAAAPELLAALRSAENWLAEYETGPDTGLQGLLAECRAAIVKAEGR